MSVNNILSPAIMNTQTIYTQSDEIGVNNKAEDIEGVVSKNAGEILNMKSNINIDKTLKGFITDALKAAGLPVNDRMMELVNSLLERQQSIDKNTLIAYKRLLGQFPGVNPETLIAMQKNGLHISKESIEQYENYKNNENQLFRNIDDAVGSIGGLVKGLISGNDGNAAITLLNGLARFVNDMTSQSGEQQPVISPDMTANVMQQPISDAGTVEGGAVLPEAATVIMDKQENDVMMNSDIAAADALIRKFGEELPASFKEKISEGNLFEKLSIILEELPKDKAIELALKLDTKEFAGLAKEVLKEALFLEPEAVADKEKLTEYYKKLEQSVNKFLNVTKELGDTVNNSTLAKTFNNIADNVTFMNQINEYMPYVQLPLKLFKEEAHGEFYVMKRRKQQAQQGDTLTAFLRLNMTNLGELDIMVKLKGQSLDVDFKAEKADVVAFIADNLVTLEDRLKEKGYIPSMCVGEKEKEFDFEKDFLEAESNEGTIGRYSFDMKI